MTRAIVLLKDTPHYRRDAFCKGLSALGYRVLTEDPGDPKPDDLLVIWNRYGPSKKSVGPYEAAGATVIVTENGFVGEHDGKRLYQVALNWHNGAGVWPVRSEDRWSSLGIELKSWRKSGSKILVLPQRIVGTDGVAMPCDASVWADKVKAELRRHTDRKVVVRLHPGNIKPVPVPDWTDVHAVVTWGSTAGIKAIIAGVPVFHMMPKWIGALAAKFGVEDIETPWMGDRLPMLHRMSHAQWTVDEIASGEPFRRVLECR